MEMRTSGTPLQQKSTSPTWLLYGPFSDLTVTFAGIVAEPEAELMTQNFENSLHTPRLTDPAIDRLQKN